MDLVRCTGSGFRRAGRKRVSFRFASVAGCGLTAMSLFASPAAAFELFGVHLFGEKVETRPVSTEAQRYEASLVVAPAGGDVEARLKDASRLLSEAGDTPPPSTASFLARARDDYGRLLAALYAEGRYGGTIAIEANGRPVEEIAPDATLPNPVAVRITVDPGARYVFGRIDIEGRPNRVPPQIQADIKPPKTPEDLGLVVGAPARAGAVTGSEEVLVAAWRRIGHPKARIATRRVVADHPNRRVDVTIRIDPAGAAVFGPTTVEGAEDMDPAFVARQADLPPGEEWSSDEVKRAERRLRRLEVFSSVRIADAGAIEDWVNPARQPVTITVSERPLHVFGFGGSYSTIDGAGLEGYWQHRNLFGRAEKLRVEARVSGIDVADPNRFTYSGGFTFVKPGVLDPATDLTVQLQAAREVYDPYTEEAVRFRVGLAHEFFPGLTGKLGVTLEAARVYDAWGKRDFRLLGLPGELAWDTTDDRLAPTRGYRVKGQLEPFYEMRFGNAGTIGRIDASAYRALDEKGRHVLAGRLAFGSIFGASAREIPDDRLFFAGGGGSVRGFAYRSLGPRTPAGAIVGGLSLAEASLEYRARVTDTIGVVPFVDAGTAFSSRLPDFSGKIRVGAGLGLRYHTGLGAIRFDVAAPLNPEPGDPRFGIYIGIGEAF
jgi:translocation and assembly module TamA